MKLKEFVNTYDVLYKTDIEMILAWSTYNSNQADLIAAIADLAALMHREFEKTSRKHWEWSYYAFMNLVPVIKEDTESVICLNALRLAYMSFPNDAKVFAKVADDIMISKNISWDAVNSLHPEIAEFYKEGCRNV